MRLPPGSDDVVRADVLRDAAGLAGDDVRLPDVVEQRRLAVVDVTHDGDDRRPRHELLGRVLGGVGLHLRGVLVLAHGLEAERRAISSIWSKSSRWLIVTIRPSFLNANPTIWVAGTFMAPASSDT